MSLLPNIRIVRTCQEYFDIIENWPPSVPLAKPFYQAALYQMMKPKAIDLMANIAKIALGHNPALEVGNIWFCNRYVIVSVCLDNLIYCQLDIPPEMFDGDLSDLSRLCAQIKAAVSTSTIIKTYTKTKTMTRKYDYDYSSYKNIDWAKPR